LELAGVRPQYVRTQMTANAHPKEKNAADYTDLKRISEIREIRGVFVFDRSLMDTFAIACDRMYKLGISGSSRRLSGLIPR
jgi:hypothetical protein